MFALSVASMHREYELEDQPAYLVGDELLSDSEVAAYWTCLLVLLMELEKQLRSFFCSDQCWRR